MAASVLLLVSIIYILPTNQIILALKLLLIYFALLLNYVWINGRCVDCSMTIVDSLSWTHSCDGLAGQKLCEIVDQLIDGLYSPLLTL
jgi:hypothetical protein